MIIYIIGMPGCGKSKTAKYLQIEKNQYIIDLDKYIEEQLETDIPTIFSKYGEEYFRLLETRALEQISDDFGDVIVSCGGGVVTNSNNFTVMKKGVTVFLDAPIETLKEHLCNSSTQRPLLKVKTIEQIYNERIELYRKFADVTISYNSYIEAADEIMEIINGKLKKKILVINGPNLNMLGLRDPKHYGTLTLDEINNMIKEETAFDFEFYQSNHEGAIVDKLQEYKKYDGIIINPAAYTHTSVAILDALKAVGLPTVEVHLSNINSREEFRKFSYISLYAAKTICGKGFEGYTEALDFFL